MSSSPSEKTYRVDYSRVVPTLRYLSYLSKRLGFALALAESLREINRQLQHDPVAWGDPLWDLKGMNAKYFRGWDKLLIAYYAVHVKEPVVMVQRIERNPFSDFYGS